MWFLDLYKMQPTTFSRLCLFIFLLVVLMIGKALAGEFRFVPEISVYEVYDDATIDHMHVYDNRIMLGLSLTWPLWR